MPLFRTYLVRPCKMYARGIKRGYFWHPPNIPMKHHSWYSRFPFQSLGFFFKGSFLIPVANFGTMKINILKVGIWAFSQLLYIFKILFWVEKFCVSVWLYLLLFWDWFIQGLGKSAVVSTILFSVENDRISIVEFVNTQQSFLLPTF